MSSITKVQTKGGVHYKANYELPRFIDGKRRKTSKTFPIGTSLKTVKEFLAKKDLELIRGCELENNPNITVAELGQIYFDTYTSFLSPTTIKGYKAVYFNSKPHGILNYFGACQVRKIKTRDIQDYINILSNKVSAKSVRNYVLMLNLLFDLAVTEHLIQREANPMLGKLVLPKNQRKQVEAYDLEEFYLLLKLAEQDDNPNIELIMNLALLSGIRRGEMCGLKWNNVSFEEGYIYIIESRVVVHSKTTVKAPKTSSGVRKIYIPQRLVDILKKYHTQYMLNKMKFGRHFIDSNYVVSKENGEPYSPQGITNCYVRFMERHSNKIRYLKFHGLRHTYASVLIEQGENPKTVQHNLGHSDVSFTLQIYSHTYESAQKNAALKLDETIENIRKTG